MTEDLALRLVDEARVRADRLARRLSAARRLHLAATRFTDSECVDEATTAVVGLRAAHARALDACSAAEDILAQIRTAKSLGIAS